LIRIINRLDVKNENLVKGIHLEGLRTLGPLSLFAKYYAKENIDEIFLSDSIASLFGNSNLLKYLEVTTKELNIPITVSGGIKSIHDIDKFLSAGADKVCINSEAIRNNNFLVEIVKNFGSSTITIEITTKRRSANEFLCFIDNGRENSNILVEDWVDKAQEIGVGEIFLTSIDKEGTMSGFDTELISKIENKIKIPFIVAGGAGKPKDLSDTSKKFKNIDGFCIASITHFDLMKKNDFINLNLPFGMEADFSLFDEMNGYSIREIKKELLKENIEVRN
jgi:cyclase